MADLENIQEAEPNLLRELRAEAFKRGETHILSLLNSAIVTHRVPTMGTDGKRLYVNPSWAKSIGPNKALGVLLHELFHDLFEHHTRPWAAYKGDPDISKEIWKELSNLAMDVIINDEVLKLGYQLPEDGTYRKNLTIPDSLNTSYKVFKKLIEDYKDDLAARRRIEEALRALKEKELQRQKILTIPKVARNVAPPKPQPKPPTPTQPPVLKEPEKKIDGMTRDQLITRILQEQTLYGGN